MAKVSGVHTAQTPSGLVYWRLGRPRREPSGVYSAVVTYPNGARERVYGRTHNDVWKAGLDRVRKQVPSWFTLLGGGDAQAQ